MQKILSTLMLIPALCLLGACDSAPTDADLQQAMRAQMEREAGKKAAAMWEKDIATMKVVECKKGELKSYDCAVSSNMGARQLKLIKADKSWLISQ